jgi:hypothetical protein
MKVVFEDVESIDTFVAAVIFLGKQSERLVFNFKDG